VEMWLELHMMQITREFYFVFVVRMNTKRLYEVS
jgi:hypothetical protein